ncbi:uncharacterized protein LOC124641597 [Helicoverpa zea]|uniref:uncharacterized protein LOC124641597 n=1 Tax=Helicoverpa zea TaxID=7113 RepID=UPI001F5657B6|nr:uncharacterized protein LOC124641597 [Helicoverpa zea]
MLYKYYYYCYTKDNKTDGHDDDFKTLLFIISHLLQVLLFTVGTFGFAINSIAEHIEIGKRTAMSVDTFVPLAAVSLSWLIKNMVLFIYLVFECEKFYSDMTEIRNTCLRLTVSRQSSDIQKIICKNIERIHTTVFEKLNAYQLYDVDAKILLSFCGLVTGYTVVTLQFEFL